MVLLVGLSFFDCLVVLFVLVFVLVLLLVLVVYVVVLVLVVCVFVGVGVGVVVCGVVGVRGGVCVGVDVGCLCLFVGSWLCVGGCWL